MIKESLLNLKFIKIHGKKKLIVPRWLIAWYLNFSFCEKFIKDHNIDEVGSNFSSVWIIILIKILKVTIN
jgi:hypothetical protein